MEIMLRSIFTNLPLSHYFPKGSQQKYRLLITLLGDRVSVRIAFGYLLYPSVFCITIYRYFNEIVEIITCVII